MCAFAGFADEGYRSGWIAGFRPKGAPGVKTHASSALMTCHCASVRRRNAQSTVFSSMRDYLANGLDYGLRLI